MMRLSTFRPAGQIDSYRSADLCPFARNPGRTFHMLFYEITTGRFRK